MTEILASKDTSRTQLRRQLRARRRALSFAQQRSAADQLAKGLAAQLIFQRAKNIAAYLPSDGEISPEGLIERAWTLGKRVYLPVLAPRFIGSGRHMWFVEYRPTSAMVGNRFGILEPSIKNARRLKAQYLSLVLMPLVGFDDAGNRLGMGGGYYDRAFAFKRLSSSGSPQLLGMAHSCQQVDQLNEQSWDIPVAGVVTESALIRSSSVRGIL